MCDRERERERARHFYSMCDREREREQDTSILCVIETDKEREQGTSILCDRDKEAEREREQGTSIQTVRRSIDSWVFFYTFNFIVASGNSGDQLKFDAIKIKYEWKKFLPSYDDRSRIFQSS